MSDDLIDQVKQLIIDTFPMEGISRHEIDPDAPLFGDGLGLDSMDALQLVIGMENTFGVVVPDATIGARVFRSVRAMAAYIDQHMV